MNTYSIVITEPRTGKVIGWYSSNVSIPTDRNKAVKFDSLGSVRSGLEWCRNNWFRIYGYTPTFSGLVN